MVDGLGTTKYTYSAAGQLLTEDGPFASDTVTLSYSNRLRVGLSLQQPTGSWTNGFGYDSVKRLTNVTSPAGAFGYLYESGVFTHHPERITLPNTSYITNVFDADARLTETYLKKSDNNTFDSYVYIYNPANQRTNLTRKDLSTVAYKYDKIGQLTVADSSVASEDRGYTYDAAWNLNWRTNNGNASQFKVNGLNELTNAFSTPKKYDSNGNMTNSGFASDIVYRYDDENRLIAATNSGTGPWAVQFFYDGLGRLRERQDYTFVSMVGFVPVAPVYYVYDGWRVIQERDNANTPTVSYTRGNDLSGTMEGAGGIGGLLARSSGYSGGNFTTHNFYFAEGNGNVTYMLNSSQSMVASYRYDPFGNTISSSGTLASANVYRFSSKEIHANSGMYYYGYRFYDPNLQRWINRDPAEERAGFNLYTFVFNQPCGLVDRLGLSPAPTSPIPWPKILWPILFPNPQPPQQPPQPQGPPASNPKPFPGLPLSGPAAFCLVLSPTSTGDPDLDPRTKTCTYSCPGVNRPYTITVPINVPCPESIDPWPGVWCHKVGEGPLWNTPGMPPYPKWEPPPDWQPPG